MDLDLADAVEILPGRLYWVALRSYPKNTAKSHYFCVDNDLVYEPFFADFGPLNLSNTFRYCKLVEGKLRDPSLVHKRIIHYCSFDSKKRTNAAYLICAFQVMALGRDAESAFSPFHGICPSFMPFRDATCGHCIFPLTIFDCLEGLAESIGEGLAPLSRDGVPLERERREGVVLAKCVCDTRRALILDAVVLEHQRFERAVVCECLGNCCRARVAHRVARKIEVGERVGRAEQVSHGIRTFSARLVLPQRECAQLWRASIHERAE